MGLYQTLSPVHRFTAYTVNIVNVTQWFVVHLVGITQRESYSLLRKLGPTYLMCCTVTQIGMPPSPTSASMLPPRWNALKWWSILSSQTDVWSTPYPKHQCRLLFIGVKISTSAPSQEIQLGRKLPPPHRPSRRSGGGGVVGAFCLSQHHKNEHDGRFIDFCHTKHHIYTLTSPNEDIRSAH